MFKAGEGVPQDFALAARLLQQAADNGYLRANLPLAQLYASGQGVEKDLARARELALRSADSGDVESYLWLLRGYRAGGVFGENPRESALLAGRVSALLHQRLAEHNGPRATNREHFVEGKGGARRV